MNFGIKDRRVLVTGGSRGIGAAITKAFAGEGCKVSVIARNEDNLRKVIEQIGGLSEGHEFVATDLLEPGVPSRAINELMEHHGPFDIAVHNVGGGLGVKDPIADVTEWSRVWHFNVGIAIEMNAVLVPPMQEQQWGRIIHISSISAISGGPKVKPFGGAAQYSAAKSYLNTYTKALGRELAKDNIVVTAIMPGVVLSAGKHWDRLQKSNPELVGEYLRNHSSIGRFGNAEEIAPFAVFLASEQASFASSSIVSIDGGAL